ncbi:MAG: hypothetical protein MR598_03260 [Erysipelotrichaceae bacterium]|nr:hypothetical protein [Erysipelotrichaceae bacterium]
MFTKEEIKKYHKEQEELPGRINAYIEIENTSYVNKLEKRLNEVNFIIKSLENKQQLDNARKIISEYQRRYGKIEVD